MTDSPRLDALTATGPLAMWLREARDRLNDPAERISGPDLRRALDEIEGLVVEMIYWRDRYETARELRCRYPLEDS